MRWTHEPPRAPGVYLWSMLWRGEWIRPRLRRVDAAVLPLPVSEMVVWWVRGAA